MNLPAAWFTKSLQNCLLGGDKECQVDRWRKVVVGKVKCNEMGWYKSGGLLEEGEQMRRRTRSLNFWKLYKRRV